MALEPTACSTAVSSRRGWAGNVQQVLVLLQLEVMSMKRAGLHIGQLQPELWHSFCALCEGCRSLIFAFVSSMAGCGLFLDASLISILWMGEYRAFLCTVSRAALGWCVDACVRISNVFVLRGKRTKSSKTSSVNSSTSLALIPLVQNVFSQTWEWERSLLINV